ncbi:DUF5067 domain-containing protein [Leuconostoc lactis]|uniref:DUF5067 domain-containing protein n=1 Tax=Leuconostoc lactis TaxID=1246 RepID=UPI00289DC192|nr:DUF5067 domain-containing protein [Leuconostoc lactis]
MNKKYLIIISALVAMVFGLGGYIIGTHSDSEPKKKVSSHKSDKDDKDDDKSEKDDDDDNKASEKSKTPAKREWTFKNDVFSAGIMTYKLTKSEVLDSSEEGKKALVIYADVTNNTDKEQDLSNIYTVMHAFQKTDTANKDLIPGMIKSDDNGNNPIQQQVDALNDKLLGKKTVPVAMVFTLENDNPVTVKFSNVDSKIIGKKEYNVK